MMISINIYILLYIFYCIFGYNFLYRISEKKNIDICKFKIKSYAFIGKRIVMLSHLDFLYAYYFFLKPTIQKYYNIILLQLVINIGYFIIWKFNEISTLLMHIFWGFFIIIHTSFYIKLQDFYIMQFNNQNYLLIIFLFFYLQIYKFIYTKRHILYDNL